LHCVKIEGDPFAHRFFRKHDEGFPSMSGRTRTIAECNDAIEMFLAIDADLAKLMRRRRRSIAASGQPR
jgi:hypothetical protein